MAWPCNLGSFKVIKNGPVRQTMYDFLGVRHCSVLYRLWVIWRLIISWPWNLALRSLKIIETGAIRKIGCGFLFALYNNYGAILYCLRDSNLLVENREIFIPHLFLYCTGSPHKGWTRRNFVKMFDAGKTRMIGLPYGAKNYDNMLSCFHLILERHGQTYRRTDRIAISILCVSVLTRDKNWS